MMVATRNRVEVLHGVNFDMLGSRDRLIYGDFTLTELEVKIKRFARDLKLEAAFFQTNSEGEFVEHLHRLHDLADGIVLNPGAWTHYSWAIRDALEIAALPAVEVHLSDVEHREAFRRISVVRELCVATISGRGADGYRDALKRLKEELAG